MSAVRTDYSKSVLDGTSTQVWLVAILIAAASLRILAFVGLIGADDVSVAAAAEKILHEGFFLPDSHYSARIGITLPLAGIFGLFGVGEIQLVALPFLASLAGIYLAYKITAEVLDEKTALIAAAMLAIFPLDVRFASVLIPDAILGSLCAAAFFCAMRSSRTELPQRWPVWAVGGGLLWGWGYLVKVEAVFLAIPLALLLVKNPKAWRPAALFVATFAFVLLAENIIYLIMGGSFLHRLSVVSASSGGAMDEAFSATQLWIFPKSWFLTAYYFGMHYYILFVSISYILFKRKSEMYIFVAWIAIFLAWLQFGGSPFSETYTVKSHLQRYCLMINIPIALTTAFLLSKFIWHKKTTITIMFVSFFLVINIYLINFNMLSSEREMAAKSLIRYAAHSNLNPLYLDKGTYDIATFLSKGGLGEKSIKFINMQDHNFGTGETKVIDPAFVNGYVGITFGLMEYRKNRYFMDPIPTDIMKGRIVKTIDNPAPWSSYVAARVISFVAGKIPVVPAENIATQADALVQERDAAIFRGGLLDEPSHPRDPWPE